jgi:hypothetical protein
MRVSDSKSQSLIVLSLDAEVNTLSPGEKARDVTQAVCPMSIWAVPVAKSQTRIVLSFDADTSNLSSVVKAKQRTVPVWH